MSETNPRRCLVTGGAGFIGSHIVELLLARGHEVAVLDNLSSGRRENLPEGVPIFELDINSPEIDGVLAEFRPAAIFHEAAQVSVSFSVRRPELDATVNILGSINLLTTAARHDVRKIVYASSGASYGSLETLPLKEELRTMPVSPYGVSKHTVEHYLRSAANEWGLEWVALRYSNVYGPRQDPHGEAGVVAIFLNQLLAGGRPTIFDDGELTRDYIFVEDVARANLAALETDLAGHPDPVFNVSTCKSTSVNSLYAMLLQSLGIEIEAEYGPPRPGDVRHSLLDSSRAREHLGWESCVDVQEGVRRTVEYFSTRVNG